MIFILQLIFWICVFMLFHSYVLYPVLLKVFSRGKKLTISSSEKKQLPVSILMSAYNEQKVIAKKIESIFSSDYDFTTVEVLIGSDCSDDDTDKIIELHQKKYSSLKLKIFNQRSGKPAILNELVKEATNDIIIFTDANVFFESSTIKNLVRHFEDEKTGLVGATILNEGMHEDGISMQEKSYIQSENKIKFYEGVLWGTMMGPFGGCFAMRKNLFQPIPANFIVDDFYLSMIVLEKNKQCICDDKAVCYEDVSNELQQEFRRKTRISAGNFQNLQRFRKFIFKPFSAAGFCFISHKVFRWWGPFALLAILVCSAALSFSNDVYKILCATILFLFAFPVFDFLQKKLELNNYIIRLGSYFVWMNMALLAGYINFKKGVKSNVWDRTERTN